MHDINFIRKNREYVELKLRERGLQESSVEDLLRLDEHRRQLIKDAESRQAEVNRNSHRIGAMFKLGKVNEAEQAKFAVRQRTQVVRQLEAQKRRIEGDMEAILSRLPNLLHDSVPIGQESSRNVEIRRWGRPRSFEFEPRSHWDIAESLGILDTERATKLTGARFALYRDAGARMERALASFMLDVHTIESGYTEILPPFVANSRTLFGTGNLPKFETELYNLSSTDYWLIPTAEVPLTSMFRDEIIPTHLLPIKLTAWTPCFRREAGSHGRDVRGILRQHQFQKVELVKIVRPDRSYDELEGLVNDAEKILQRLELPYRVMLLCTGDTGFASAKTYDIEVWLPGQNEYREISSCSNCEAFQARRANIRARLEPGSKPDFVHSLNGSGLAIGRTWLAILENYQQADGSIKIPAALLPYMNGMTEIALTQ